MSDGLFSFGREGGVAAGLVRCASGATMLRIHDAAWGPDWFSPGSGNPGRWRYDQPAQVGDAPGTCYIAPTLEAVLLEAVIREDDVGLRDADGRLLLTLDDVTDGRALSRAVTTRDLVLVDLVRTSWTGHRYQQDQLSPRPRRVGPGENPYASTQRIAAELAARFGPGIPQPVPVDGILYASRFGAGHVCLAVWDVVRTALRWSGGPEPLTTDMAALERALDALGVGLLDP